VIADPVALHEGDEVGRRVRASADRAKCGLPDRKFSGAVNIREVAPAAAGDEDLPPRLGSAFEHHHRRAAPASAAANSPAARPREQ
jgi:hypothetical protein